MTGCKCHTDPRVVYGFDNTLEFSRNFQHKVLVEARLDGAASWQRRKVVDT